MSPWQSAADIALKRRRLVFENTCFRVFSDHIAEPGGLEVKRFLVVAPHTDRQDLTTGVAVLPLWNGRVVLLRRFRHAVGGVVLEAPRGFLDQGEAPHQAALRELSEETGLICAPENLISLGFCMPEAGIIAARVALFAATKCSPGGRRDKEEIGLGERVDFSLHEAEQLLRDMTLEDVTTCVALHRLFSAPRNGLGEFR